MHILRLILLGVAIVLVTTACSEQAMSASPTSAAQMVNSTYVAECRPAWLSESEVQPPPVATSTLASPPLVIEYNRRLGNGLALQLTWSPDDRLLAVGGSIGVHLYDTQTYARLHFLDTKSLVRSLAFSPDSRLLAVGDDQQRVQLWDVITGQRLYLFGLRNEEAIQIAFSPDGVLLAAGTTGGSIWFWDVATWRPVCMRNRHTGAITGIAFSPDGRWLASTADKMVSADLVGPEDTTVRLWNSHTGELIHTYELSHNSDTVGFSPDGLRLAAAESSGRIYIWDSITGAEVQTFLTGRSERISFAPDGRLITLDTQGTLRVWSIAGELIDKWRITIPESREDVWFPTMALNPDGERVATLTDENIVRVWQMDNGQLVNEIDDFSFPVQTVAFGRDGQILASGSVGDGSVKIWDVATGEIIHRLQGRSNAVLSIDINPDGLQVAAVPAVLIAGDIVGDIYNTGQLRPQIWEIDSECSIGEFGVSGLYHAVRFSPDGRQIATANYDIVQLWDVNRLELVREFQANESIEIDDLVFSPDGWRLAAGSREHRALIWDVATGGTLNTFEKDGPVLSVAFSPDGRYLAQAGSSWLEGRFDLWDTKSDMMVHDFTSVHGRTNTVDFSPDGRGLVSGGSQLAVWNAQDYRLLCVLTGHTDAINDVAVDASGHTLASASSDGTIILWNITWP